MSPERVEKIYSTYLESTKEDSDDFIGAFGIGSKSPLSYQDIFYINTRFDSTEYNYIMRKGESGPAIDLLGSTDTTERNGTEIKIYIKSEYDLKLFLKECRKQLMYFTNVVFDLEDIKPLFSYSYSEIKDAIDSLEKDYNLVEGQNFIFRTDQNKSNFELHLSIGGVYYPIDWDNLGVTRITFPAALKFNIGELSVIQTREDVRYTDNVIKAIKQKIKDLQEEIIELYNKKVEEEYSFKDFFFEKDLDGNYLDLEVNGEKYELNISSLLSGLKGEKLNAPQLEGFPIKFKNIREARKVKDFSNLSLDSIGSTYSSNMVNIFNSNISYRRSFTDSMAISAKKCDIYPLKNIQRSYVTISNIYKEFINLSQFYLISTEKENYSVKVNKYILTELAKDVSLGKVAIVKYSKTNKIKFSQFKTLYRRFCNEFGAVTVREFNNILQYFIKHINEVRDKAIKLDYDSVVVPDKWWKEYKKENYSSKGTVDRSKLKIEKFNERSKTWDRDNSLTIEQINNIKNCVVILLTKDEQKQYCSNNNDSNTKLEKLLLYTNRVLNKKTDIHLYASANTNTAKVLKNRKENTNIYSLTEFFNDKKMQQKVLGKIGTYLKIKAYINEFNSSLVGCNFDQLNNIITIFNENLVKEYNEIMTFVSQTANYGITLPTVQDLQSLIDELDEIDTTHYIYDHDMLNKFNDFIKFVHDSKIRYIYPSTDNVANFVNNYKPSKFKYRLHQEWNLKFTSYEEIANYFKVDITGYNADKDIAYNLIRYHYYPTHSYTSPSIDFTRISEKVVLLTKLFMLRQEVKLLTSEDLKYSKTVIEEVEEVNV